MGLWKSEEKATLASDVSPKLGANLDVNDFALTSSINLIYTAPTEIIGVLKALDGSENDFFGTSCALSSDRSVLAVGAYQWEGTYSAQGGVYIYDWSGSTWIQRGDVLEAADAAIDDYFGSSCALSSDGSILMVGAYGWEGGDSAQGGVYSYDWSGSAWIPRGSVLEAADAAANDRFGSSCALSSDGSILVVGAPNWEGTYSSQGGIYVYDRNGDAWIPRGSILEAADAAINDYFGTSCALSSDGSVLVVGAKEWEGGDSAQGGVYIYDRNESTWTQRGNILEATDAASGDSFGASCTLSSDGNILAIGAFVWEGEKSNQGGVYIYDRNENAWKQRGFVLEAADAAINDYFGTSCALSSDGSILMVGAYQWEGTYSAQGGVYTYACAINARPKVSDYEDGTVVFKERTTPTAKVNYGKIYTKTDNKLYFQSGDGTEHEIAFA